MYNNIPYGIVNTLRKVRNLLICINLAVQDRVEWIYSREYLVAERRGSLNGIRSFTVLYLGLPTEHYCQAI